jgi:hypothetical protein
MILATTGVLPSLSTAYAAYVPRLTGTASSISGNTLTIGGTVTGGIPLNGNFPAVAFNVVGGTTSAGTQLTGAKGGAGAAGTYFVSPSQTVASASISIYDSLPLNKVYTVQNPSGTTFNLADPAGHLVGISSAGTGTHTAISNPLRLSPNMCPSLSVFGSTGHELIEDARNAPTQGRPFLSFSSRSLLGQMPAATIPRPMRVQGRLKQMIVNVAKADQNGATSTLSITARGFDASLAPLNFSATINLKIAGTRIISQSAPVNPQTGDTLPAYAGSISQYVQLSETVSVGGQPAATYAQVYVSVETDQGIFATPAVVNYVDPQWGGYVVTEVDSTVPGPGTFTGI